MPVKYQMNEHDIEIGNMEDVVNEERGRGGKSTLNSPQRYDIEMTHQTIFDLSEEKIEK